MATIKLELKKKTDTELIAFARKIIIRMVGSSYFMSTEPQLNELNEAINAFESVHASKNTPGRNGKTYIKLRRNELELKIASLALFVEEITDGNAMLIIESGMEVRRGYKS